MKRMCGVLSLCYFLLFAVAAQAASFTDGPLALELPNGWEAHHFPDKNLTAIASPKGDYALTLTVMPKENVDVKTVANEYAKDANASTPKLVKGTNNSYSCRAIIDGDAGTITMAGTDHGIVIMTEMGDGTPYRAEKRAVWNSLKSSDKAIQAVLSGLIKHHSNGTLTINVPPGWKTESDADTGGLGAVSPDGKCMVGAILVPAGQTPGPEMAASLSKALNGATPETDPADNTFSTFECILDGKETNFTVITRGGFTLAWYEAGDVDNYWDEVNMIVWNSLESSASEHQALIESLKVFEEE